MLTDVLHTIGGLGLFLLGMLIITSGLRELAAGSLRKWLRRWTSTPLTGAVTGAFATAVLQSSSATTVTTVGFVAAGLLTLPQAIGIIFGANIGTTVTGWLVVWFGFKLHLGSVVMPLVFLGVALHLFSRGKLRHVGWSLAGFGLVFIGIEFLQDGMGRFEGVITPDNFPTDTWWGRLQLVALGIGITLVTQSSSAGVAMAIAAIGAGAISFTQGAALVIGMDVGTTFTTVLATIGGSVTTRRTGFAHVVYNLFAGSVAFILLGSLTALLDTVLPGGTSESPQVALVAFHTLFNVIGVFLILPFANQFADLLRFLIPDKGPQLTALLDDRLLSDPEAATDALRGTIERITEACHSTTMTCCCAKRLNELNRRIEETETALRETYEYADKLRFVLSRSDQSATHVTSMHVLDHLDRLLSRCKQSSRIESLKRDHRLQRLSNVLCKLIETRTDVSAEVRISRFDRLRKLLRSQRRRYRETVLTGVATGHFETDDASVRLDAMRWLHRVAYHLWRIEYHMDQLRRGSIAAEDVRETTLDVAEED